MNKDQNTANPFAHRSTSHVNHDVAEDSIGLNDHESVQYTDSFQENADMPRIVFHLIVALICSWAANDCYGQMVTTSVPYQTSSNSFFENNSINWSLRGKNWFANSGGSPLPPFGGMAGGGAVAGGLAGRFGFAGGGVRGRLGFNFSQGSTRSFSSTTPSLTTMNGYPGSISSGVLQPFVTGISPVVGNYAAAMSPLAQSRKALAETGQQQISNLRQSQSKRYQGKLAQYLQR
ncbi:MAG TPA: hypothetical protein DEF45_07430, partial [Rhodopirellula sp.]|nr:hypothetical protein [Rhodopirellula sp.]